MESKSIKTGQSKRPGDTQLVLYLLPLPSITLEWGDLNAKKRTIRIIQNLMGHASIVTTERYSHVLDDEKRKAIDRMSGFLSGMGDPVPGTPQQAKNLDCNKTATIQFFVIELQ